MFRRPGPRQRRRDARLMFDLAQSLAVLAVYIGRVNYSGTCDLRLVCLISGGCFQA